MCLCGPGNRVRSTFTVVSWMVALTLSIIRCGRAANLVAEPQLVQQAQRAGVHGVAAEVAQEVGVLLHHRDVHPGAGEQQRRASFPRAHRPRRGRSSLRCGAFPWGRHVVDRRVVVVGGILNWWDGVELWLSGLGFVAQTAW